MRVVILTGAGGYFCAGADRKAMSASSPSDKFRSGEFDPSMIKSLLKGYRVGQASDPAVEGPAIAAARRSAARNRVAGESARFGVSEPGVGLYPIGGSAVRLPRELPCRWRRICSSRTAHAVFASNDAKEGPRAFAEKRSPDFTGS